MTAVTADRIPIPKQILDSSVVAIGRGLDPASVVRVGEGLAAGGVGAFEVTLGRPGALESIAALHARFGAGADLIVGAGTVLSEADAERRHRRRSDVSSSCRSPTPTLVAWAAGRGIPAFPGAMTPTEALAGWVAGAAAIKLFPASVTGPAFIRELHGPFPEIPVIPTGGVTVDTAAALIMAGAVAVGIGSWLTGDGDPAGIAGRGRRIVSVIRAAREDRARRVRINSVTTYLVGNAWKNWLFVRVDTDEGIHGGVIQRDGLVDVPTAPGLGIDLDWDRLAAHPYQREHLLHLFAPGWERRDDAPMPAPDDRAAKVAPGPTAAGLTADPIGSPDPGR